MSNTAAERTVAARYVLQATLRRGRSGLIWRATDQGTGKLVAVEEVDPPLRSEAELQERWPPLAQGARTAAAFHHPGALTLHDVLLHDERFYVVSELVEGLTLDELVRRHGCLPPQRVARIGLDLLEVLEAAHQAGLIHLDLQPVHVLIGQDGRTRLGGLGLAALRRGQAAASSFLSPEQARGEPAGPAADLWGLGATLHTAVEGRPPFDGEGVAALATVLYDQPRPPRQAGPLAPALRALLVKPVAGRPAIPAARHLLTAASPAGATASASASPVEAAPDAPPTVVLGAPLTPAPATAAAPIVGGGRAARAAQQRQRGPRGRLAAAWCSLNPRARQATLVIGGSLLLALLSFGGAVAFIGSTGSSAPAAQLTPPPTEAAGPATTTAPTTSNTSATSTSSTTSTSTTVPATSAGAAPVLPGWTSYSDPQIGYRLNYPSGWAVVSGRSTTEFRDPAGGTFIALTWRRGTVDDPLAAERQSGQRHAASDQDYHQVALQTTTFQNEPAAYLEFTFQDNGVPSHAAEVGANSGAYFITLEVSASGKDWSGAMATVSGMLGSFAGPTQ